MQLISLFFGLLGTILIFFYGVSPAIDSEGLDFLIMGEDQRKKIKFRNHKIISQLGLILLVLSYLFQLFGNFNFENYVYDRIIGIVQLFVTTVIGLFAYRVAVQQTEINNKLLQINDYVELFVVPQEIKSEVGKSIGKFLAEYKLLVKNASSYPIYLQKYILNGEEKKLNNCVVPNSDNSWYGIVVPQSIYNLTLDLYYEDYLGKKYKTEVSGKKNDRGWEIYNNRRELVKNIN
jgi:hypothetical protein